MRSLILAASLLLTTPALATEWIICSDADEQVSIGLLAGGLDFHNFGRATLQVGDEAWATQPEVEPGTPMMIVESYADDRQLYVKLADDNAERVIADLRVFIADEGTELAKGGVLLVPGKGAWVVSCEGP